MRNRDVGFVLLGVVALLSFITYSFNQALTEIVTEACSHGPTCAMWGNVNFQTNVSIAVILVLAVVAVYFIYTDRGKTVKKKVPKELLPDEKEIYNLVVASEGTIFQSTLTEKSGLSKVKITRILDKLEGKGLVTRIRRGMTNVVILKD